MARRRSPAGDEITQRPTTGSALRRAARWAGALVATLFFLWSAGFAWFAATLPLPPAETTTKTDAIVVLTGGAGRLTEGVRLLRAGLAPVLFVSGVNRKVTRADILKLAGNPPEDLAERIILGYRAEHTRGNATEIAHWFNSKNLKSMRLVTSNYHMRRSLIELRHALPHARIVPNTVVPNVTRPTRWWRSPSGLAILVGEYHKYVAAYLRLVVTRTR
jgi:uncharacterized SAM-binding protein YcdF (DUF218 family)